MTFIPLTTQNSNSSNLNSINIALRDINTAIRPLRTPSKDWIVPALLNGWVNYGSGFPDAGYRKDALGYVHLHGLIKNGVTVDGTPIFNLPAGFRPKATLHIVAIGNSAAGHIKITTTSVAYGTNTGNGWLSLDGISFLAEA